MLDASTDGNVEPHSLFSQPLDTSASPRCSNAGRVSSNHQPLSSMSQPVSPNSGATEVFSPAMDVFAQRLSSNHQPPYLEDARPSVRPRAGGEAKPCSRMLYMLDDPGVDDDDNKMMHEELFAADPRGREGRPASPERRGA
jgi:hypothetical protein